MKKYGFRQGDQGRIFFKVIIGDVLFEDNLIDDIEICIDQYSRKTLKDSEIYYHKDLQSFSFLLTQEDTEYLNPGKYCTLIRVKLKDLDGFGSFIHTIHGPIFEIYSGFTKEII